MPLPVNQSDRSTTKLAELQEAEHMRRMIKDNLDIIFPGIDTQIILHNDSSGSLTASVVKRPTEKDIEACRAAHGGRFYPTVLVTGREHSGSASGEVPVLARVLAETRARVAKVLGEAIENGFAVESLQM